MLYKSLIWHAFVPASRLAPLIMRTMNGNERETSAISSEIALSGNVYWYRHDDV